MKRVAVGLVVAIALAGCGSAKSHTATQTSTASTTAKCASVASPLHATGRKETLHSTYTPAGFVLRNGDPNAVVPTMQEYGNPKLDVNTNYEVLRTLGVPDEKGDAASVNGLPAIVQTSTSDKSIPGPRIDRIIVSWHPQPGVTLSVNASNLSRSETLKIADGVVYTRTDYPPSVPAGCTPSGKPKVSGIISREDILARQSHVEGATYEAKLVRIGDMKTVDPGIFGGCVQQACDDDVVAWAVLRRGGQMDIIGPPGGPYTTTRHQLDLVDASNGTGSAGGESGGDETPSWWNTITDYDA